MSLNDLVGSAAAFLTTASFLPQAWLSFKTRDVSGVSLGMYSVFTTGVALWLAYGWLLGSWPIVIANTVTLVLAVAILVMKLLYGRKPGHKAAWPNKATGSPACMPVTYQNYSIQETFAGVAQAARIFPIQWCPVSDV